MKKVLFISRITTAHGSAGGMESSFRDMAGYFAANQISVALITTPGLREDDDLKIFEKIWTVRGARSGKYSLRWWLFTYRHPAIVDWEPDVVISISSAGTASLFGNPSVPHVAQCHGTALAEVKSAKTTGGLKEYAKIILNFGRIIREVPAYRTFSEVWSVSQEVTAQLSQRPYSVNRSSVFQITNGVDPDQFAFDVLDRKRLRADLGIGPNISLGITLSRLHKQKGVDIAIESLAESGGSERALLILGDGPHRSELEILAAELGVADRVFFRGSVDKTDIAAYLSAADALIFPTRRREGLSLSLLEALTSGLPVLTTRECNVPDDLVVGVTFCGHEPASVSTNWPVPNKISFRENSSLPLHYTKAVMEVAYLNRAQSISRELRE